MYWFSMSVALLVSVGIITIGVMYLTRPATAMRSFGLPLPGEGESTMWWLRLKGVRDIAAGLLVLALMLRAEPQIVGIALLIDARGALDPRRNRAVDDRGSHSSGAEVGVTRSPVGRGAWTARPVDPGNDGEHHRGDDHRNHNQVVLPQVPVRGDRLHEIRQPRHRRTHGGEHQGAEEKRSTERRPSMR